MIYVRYLVDIDDIFKHLCCVKCSLKIMLIKSEQHIYQRTYQNTNIDKTK